MERGTIARVDDALEKFETRSHMLREAIERELERRQRQQRARRFQIESPELTNIETGRDRPFRRSFLIATQLGGMPPQILARLLMWELNADVAGTLRARRLTMTSLSISARL
jgi:Arc/MetJ-type ribon-helix-helix transcriptional regulator